MSALPVLAGLLVLLGAGGAAYAIWRRNTMRVANLREVLELSYLEQDPQLKQPEVSSLLARSGAFAERALADTTLLARLKSVVERSDWSLTPGELLSVSVAAAVIGGVLGWLASPLLALVLFGVGLGGPIAAVSQSVAARRRKFDSQLPDILDLVAASLESGASVQQALELVVSEAEEPSASEFARVLTGTRIGTPLTEALQTMADRLGSRDLSWTVQAIIVQQRTGGRLAEVLRIVAGVMRSREEVRRELRALTAEGRLSAYILTALPIILISFFTLVRPKYLHPLYTTRLGLVLLVGAGMLIVGSYFAMMRIVRIEV